MKEERDIERRKREVDSQTKLGSREAFDRARQAADADPDVEWLMIDIDNLKGTNEVEGHDAGDALIKRVADAIGDASSRGFRSGGDEFPVAVPAGQGEQIGRAIEEAVGRQKIGDTGLDAGVSYGVGSTFDEADAAVRAKKDAKRDAGVAYRDLNGSAQEAAGAPEAPAATEEAPVPDIAPQGEAEAGERAENESARTLGEWLDVATTPRQIQYVEEAIDEARVDGRITMEEAGRLNQQVARIKRGKPAPEAPPAASQPPAAGESAPTTQTPVERSAARRSDYEGRIRSANTPKELDAINRDLMGDEDLTPYDAREIKFQLDARDAELEHPGAGKRVRQFQRQLQQAYETGDIGEVDKVRSRIYRSKVLGGTARQRLVGYARAMINEMGKRQPPAAGESAPSGRPEGGREVGTQGGEGTDVPVDAPQRPSAPQQRPESGDGGEAGDARVPASGDDAGTTATPEPVGEAGDAIDESPATRAKRLTPYEPQRARTSSPAWTETRGFTDRFITDGHMMLPRAEVRPSIAKRLGRRAETEGIGDEPMERVWQNQTVGANTPLTIVGTIDFSKKDHATSSIVYFQTPAGDIVGIHRRKLDLLIAAVKPDAYARKGGAEDAVVALRDGKPVGLISPLRLGDKNAIEMAPKGETKPKEALAAVERGEAAPPPAEASTRGGSRSQIGPDETWEQQSDAVRRTIQQRALEIAKENGWRSGSIDLIAERVGIPRSWAVNIFYQLRDEPWRQAELKETLGEAGEGSSFDAVQKYAQEIEAAPNPDKLAAISLRIRKDSALNEEAKRKARERIGERLDTFASARGKEIAEEQSEAVRDAITDAIESQLQSRDPIRYGEFDALIDELVQRDDPYAVADAIEALDMGGREVTPESLQAELDQPEEVVGSIGPAPPKMTDGAPMEMWEWAASLSPEVAAEVAEGGNLLPFIWDMEKPAGRKRQGVDDVTARKSWSELSPEQRAAIRRRNKDAVAESKAKTEARNEWLGYDPEAVTDIEDARAKLADLEKNVKPTLYTEDGGLAPGWTDEGASRYHSAHWALEYKIQVLEKAEEEAKDVTPIGAAKKEEAPTKKAPAPAAELPRHLSGAKPRYGYRDKNFKLDFDSDVDRALYIVAQRKPSKMDAEYVGWLEQHFPDDTVAQIRSRGQEISDIVKGLARSAYDGDSDALHVPDTAAREGQQPAQTAPAKSYAVEADGGRNAKRYPTKEEATAAMNELMRRWFGASDFKVVETDDPPTDHWVKGKGNAPLDEEPAPKQPTIEDAANTIAGAIAGALGNVGGIGAAGSTKLDLGKGRTAEKRGDTWYVTTKTGTIAYPNDPAHAGFDVYQAMEERLGAQRSAKDMGAPTPDDTLNAIEDEAKERLRKLREKRGGGEVKESRAPYGGESLIPQEELFELAMVGAVKITRGTRDRAEWDRLMLKDFGNDPLVALELDNILRASHAILETDAPAPPRTDPQRVAAMQKLADIYQQKQELADLIAAPEGRDNIWDGITTEAGNVQTQEVRPPAGREPAEAPSSSPPGADGAGSPAGVPGPAPSVGGTAGAGAPHGDAEERPASGGLRGGGSTPRNPPKGGGGDRAVGTDTAARDADLAHKGTNYRITEDDELGVGGPKAKARANLEAIRLLKLIQAQGREATREEQSTLVKFVGWGGLKGVLEPYNREWAEERKQLFDILTQEEWEAAERNILNAHYTAPEVIRGIYDALKRLGIKRGRFMEPAAGVGHFIGLFPSDMVVGSSWGAVELDPITGGILKLLYPKASVTIDRFENVRVPDGFFDVYVGNVPFMDSRPVDPNDPALSRRKFLLHDFFFAKAISKVRPGGLVAMITSSGTMDKRSPRIREFLAKRAELVGAIRLPRDAFKANANTLVTTDILFLRRLEDGEEPTGETFAALSNVGTERDPIFINEYFARHPEMMLGDMARLAGRYGAALEQGLVAPVGQDIAKALADAVGRLPAGVIKPRVAKTDIQKRQEAMEPEDAPPDMIEGAYIIRGGAIQMRQAGKLVSPFVPKSSITRVKALIELRDLSREVIDVQRVGGTDDVLKKAQRQLEKAYDAFVKKWGRLNLRKIDKRGSVSYHNVRYFADPELGRVLALEHVDDDGKISKGSIFTTRVIRPPEVPTAVEQADEALLISLNETGRVDIPRIASLLGKDEAETIRELGPAIFQDPGTDAWDHADSYLSGDVRHKLAEARAAAQVDERFERNVAALEAVIPEDKKPAQISVQLGAPWITTDDVSDFVAELLNIARRDVSVAHIESEAIWKLELNARARARVRNSARGTQEWGTERVSADKLINMALNQQLPTVRDSYEDAEGRKRTFVNIEQTQMARQRQKAIRQRFSQWVWQDPERAERLAREYNDRFNSFVLRSFDGKHLTMPGAASEVGGRPFALRPHQTDFIWRALQMGNTGAFHVVGSGKTYTMIGLAMEAKRLGIANKPVITVPKITIESWERSFLEMYPGARILVADENAFDAKHRKIMTARIAHGEWDAVILTHEGFEKIPMSEEFQHSFLSGKIKNLRELLESERSAHADRTTIRELQAAIERYIARLQRIMAKHKKDVGVTFQDTGIDMVIVDEAHLFKNLEVTSRMQNLPLPSPAQRALDLYMKTLYLNGVNPGRGVYFATGTPIANTFAEAFVMQSYLQPDLLKEMGFSSFDAWAGMFARSINKVEQTAEGKLKQKTRFTFQNVDELRAMFTQVADIVSNDDLPYLKLPAVRGGKSRVVHIEAPPEMDEVLADIRRRAEWIRKNPRDRQTDNWLKLETDGRKAATDIRLYNPDYPRPENGGKVGAAAQEIAAIYHEFDELQGTQLVFLDIGTPKPGDPSLYGELRDELIEQGVKRQHIAFIHDAKTPDAREQLLDDMNTGKKRILVGSTGKMGVGMNVQLRLVALHDIDAPHRPDQLEQRHGRIIRQGNELLAAGHITDIQIIRYVTVPSYDAKMFGSLDRKQTMISSFLNGRGTMPGELEDVDDRALDYRETMAIATGDPMVMEKVEVDIRVDELEAEKGQHDYRVREAKISLGQLPSRIRDTEKYLGQLRTDLGKRVDTKGDAFRITIGDREYTDRVEAGDALFKFVKDGFSTLSRGQTDDFRIGHFAGFPLDVELRLTLGGQSGTLQLRGSTTHANSFMMQGGLWGEKPLSAQGVLQRVENLANLMEDGIQRTEANLADLQAEIPSLERVVNSPFEGEKELQEKLQRQLEIDRHFSLATDDHAATDDDDLVEDDEGDGAAPHPHEQRPAYGRGSTFDPAAKSIVAEPGRQYDRTAHASDQRIAFGTRLAADRVVREIADNFGDLGTYTVDGLVTVAERLQKVSRKALKAGWVDLRGLRVVKVANLHRALYPFRDPRMEKYHVLLLADDGKILSHSFITSGAIDYVHFENDTRFWRRVQRRAERLGATTLIIAHNHPSGVPTPSDEDLAHTVRVEKVARAMGLKFGGHYVIDDIKGNFITVENGKAEPNPIRLPWKRNPKDWTAQHGTSIDSPSAVGAVVRGVSDASGFHVLYASLQNEPIALEGHRPSAVATIGDWLPAQMKGLGAGATFLVADAANLPLIDELTHAVAAAGLTEVVDIIGVEKGKVRYNAAEQSGIFRGRKAVAWAKRRLDPKEAHHLREHRPGESDDAYDARVRRGLERFGMDELEDMERAYAEDPNVAEAIRSELARRRARADSDLRAVAPKKEEMTKGQLLNAFADIGAGEVRDARAWDRFEFTIQNGEAWNVPDTIPDAVARHLSWESGTAADETVRNLIRQVYAAADDVEEMGKAGLARALRFAAARAEVIRIADDEREADLYAAEERGDDPPPPPDYVTKPGSGGVRERRPAYGGEPGVPEIRPEKEPESMIPAGFDGSYTEAVGELVKALPRHLRYRVYKAGKAAQRWKKLLSDEQLEDLGAAVEGVANLRTGKKLAQIQIEMEGDPVMRRVFNEYKVLQEAARQEINAFLEDLHGPEYINYLDDYLAHFYTGRSKRRLAFAKGWTKKVRAAHQRRIPTLADAVDAGLKPITQNVADLHRMWAAVNWQGAMNQRFVYELMNVKGEDGLPVIRKRGNDTPNDWPVVDHPAIQKVYGRRDQDGNLHLWHGGASVDPDIYRLVKMVFDRPFGHWFVRAVEATNAYSKAAVLTLSLFHPWALMESAQGALARWKNPFGGILGPGREGGIAAPHREGLRLLDESDELIRDAVLNGLNIDPIPDVMAARVNRMLMELEAWGRGKPGVEWLTHRLRQYKEWWDRRLWEHYYTGLKAYTYYRTVAEVLGTMPEVAGPAEIRAVKRKVAGLVNDMYGGQDWDAMAVDANLSDSRVANVMGDLVLSVHGRQLLHILLLAPDWTLTNIKIAVRLITSLGKGGGRGGGGRGGGRGGEGGEGGEGGATDPIRRVEQKVVRRYWRNMLLSFFTFISVASYLLNRKFPWQQEPGHRLDIDVTPIVRAVAKVVPDWLPDWVPGAGEGDYEGRRYYIRPGKQFREVLRYLNNFADISGAKLSPMMQVAIEQISGHQAGQIGWEMPWAREEMGWYRSLPSRMASVMEKFVPFAVRGGNFAFTFPLSRGMSWYKAQKAYEDIIRAQVDPSLYDRLMPHRSAEKLKAEVDRAAEANGLDPDEQYRQAGTAVRTDYYGRMWRAIEKHDTDEADEMAGILNRLGATQESVMESGKRRGYTEEEIGDILGDFYSGRGRDSRSGSSRGRRSTR